MKKSASLSDAIWDLAPAEPEFGPATLPPGGTNATLVIDEGEPYPLAVDAGGANSVGAGSAKPFATIAQLADYLINGFWQYNGTTGHKFASNTISYNINALNPAEQFLAVSAMQAWHEVANINFVQTSSAANLTFSNSGTMQAYTTGALSGPGTIAYMNVVISSDWITNDGGAYDGKTGIDSYGYQTYIHEIGHALGLGHQGPYNGSASYSTNAIYANDTWQYSIMSYFPEDNYSGSSYRYVVTPQMADIYAMGSMYGAASSTRTGDTVYGFSSNAGAVFNFSAYSPAPALTIYDSGGNDTLDCSGYSSEQIIDLRAGAFSSVGGLVNNIGIAYKVNIENAIGGSGNDRLTANDLGCSLIGGGGDDVLVGGAGADRLIGSSGVDIMTGGGGADTFVFSFDDSSSASGQHDKISDFVSGVDLIDLTGIDAVSATDGYDLFRFTGVSGFDGIAGNLNYFFNSSLGVTVLQGDTNGDRVADFAIDLTGNVAISTSSLSGISICPPVVIEAMGLTNLVEVGNTYYLYIGGSGQALKVGGSPVTAGQYGSWAPIGAEQTASGYNVAWKAAGADQYAVWSTDGNGNYISNFTGTVPGNNIALESLETTFHQDLNGDGVIGVVPTVIEASGSTSLTEIGATFYLNAGGSGAMLKVGGSPVTAGQYGTWAPIGAEQSASGYNVVWKAAGADQYAVWSADRDGNYISNFTGTVSGKSVVLETLETAFHQDLNGDGVIGVVTTVIEAFGMTSLTKKGDTFYLNAGGSSPVLKADGSPVKAGQYGAWAPIGAEQTASGYYVAWKAAGADQYAVWRTDSNGNYISNFTGTVSGTSAALETLETTFRQDLNGDGFIGVPAGASAATAATAPLSSRESQAAWRMAGNDSFVFHWGIDEVAVGNAGPTETVAPHGFSLPISKQLETLLTEALIDRSQSMFQLENDFHDSVIGPGNHGTMNVQMADLNASHFLIR